MKYRLDQLKRFSSFWINDGKFFDAGSEVYIEVVTDSVPALVLVPRRGLALQPLHRHGEALSGADRVGDAKMALDEFYLLILFLFFRD